MACRAVVRRGINVINTSDLRLVSFSTLKLWNRRRGVTRHVSGSRQPVLMIIVSAEDY